MNNIHKIFDTKIDILKNNFSILLENWNNDINNPIYINKINDIFNALDVYNENINDIKHLKNCDNKDILSIIIPLIYGIKN